MSNEKLKMSNLFQASRLADISIQIRSVMITKNISDSELAKRLDFPKSKVEKFLTGDNNFDIRTLYLIADQLDVPLKISFQEGIKEALAQEQDPVGDDWTPCMKLPVVVYVRKQRLGESHVSTREGITPVKPDDLIMRGVSGEEYPIGRAIFEQTYSLNPAPPQPEQEPVAWRTFDGEGGYDYRSYEDNESYADDWDKRNPNHKGWVEPLYTHPPQRTEQEPVAWRNAAIRVGEDLCSVGPFGYYDMTADQWLTWALNVVTVHSFPPQRTPLTDDEIANAFFKTETNLNNAMANFQDGIRFAEAAHGIQENT